MTVVYVSGQGRCGTSLTMMMLAAGGFPVIGSAPDFEVDEVNHRPVLPDFLDSIDGHAVKLLDPALSPVPRFFPAYAIWLRRDETQQARSHAKFLANAIGRPMYNRDGVRRLAAKLKQEERIHLAALSHCPQLVIRFEDVVGPANWRTASKIAQFLRPLASLNPDAMAAVVKPRSPECLPDLNIEMQNLEAVGAT